MKLNLLRTEITSVAVGLAVLVSLPAPTRAQQTSAAREEAGVAPVSGMQIEPQTALPQARLLPACCPFPTTRPISGHVSISREIGGARALTLPTKAFKLVSN
jgi:hypothetical protein